MSERYTHLDSIKVDGIASTSQQGALIGASKVMPQPSADLDGVTIQYMGPTDSTYTFKRMYTCAMVGSEYKWIDATPVDIVQNSNGVFIGGTEIGVADSTKYGVMSPDQAEKVESSFVKLETVTEGAEPNKVDIIRVEGTPLQVSGSDKSVNITRASLGLGDSAQLDTGTLEGQIPVLGANGLLPDSTIPPFATGTFINSVRTKALLTSLNTAKLGDWAKVTSDDDFNNNGLYILNGTAYGVLSNWVQMVGPANVESVNGKSGRVVLDKEDIGLANVDNTSDAKKPISEAMQSALNLKANDNAVMHKSGDETIAGTKTFTNNPFISRSLPAFYLKDSNIPAGSAPADKTRYGTVQLIDAGDVERASIHLGQNTSGGGYVILRASNADKSSVANAQLNVASGGDAYMTAPSWSVGTADNSDKILTTKMANSLPTLVHTTGNEEISGSKIFTKPITDPRIKSTYFGTPNTDASANPYYLIGELEWTSANQWDTYILNLKVSTTWGASDENSVAEFAVKMSTTTRGAFSTISVSRISCTSDLYNILSVDNFLVYYNADTKKLQIWMYVPTTQRSYIISLNEIGRRYGTYSSNFKLYNTISGQASAPSEDEGWVKAECKDLVGISVKSTPTDAVGKEIVTADWARDKFIAKAGDTMTGSLIFPDNKGVILNNSGTDRTPIYINNEVVGSNSISFTVGGTRRTIIRSTTTDTTNELKLIAFRADGEFSGYALFDLYHNISTGERYATCPTPSSPSDNTDKIATTKWVNSASTLVHTTGNETIAGTKTFTNPIHVNSNMYIEAGSEMGLIINRTDKGMGDGWARYMWHRAFDKDGKYVGEILSTRDNAEASTSIKADWYDSDGNKTEASLGVTNKGTDMYAYAPETKDSHGDTAIVTKKYLLDKIAALEARIATLEAKP